MTRAEIGPDLPEPWANSLPLDQWAGNITVCREEIKSYIYIRGSLNKFPDFFHIGAFIDSTHKKL